MEIHTALFFMVEADLCSVMFILNIAGFSVAKYINDLNLVKIT